MEAALRACGCVLKITAYVVWRATQLKPENLLMSSPSPDAGVSV